MWDSQVKDDSLVKLRTRNGNSFNCGNSLAPFWDLF